MIAYNRKALTLSLLTALCVLPFLGARAQAQEAGFMPVGTYPESQLCPEGEALSDEQKLRLSQNLEDYRILFLDENEEPDQAIFGLYIEGAAQGDEEIFDSQYCWAEVKLLMNDQEIDGFATVIPLNPDDEHQTYPIQVLFEPNDFIKEMRFGGGFYRIAGKFEDANGKLRIFAGWNVIMEAD